MFAHIAGKIELMFSALDPASRLGSIEEGMCLALEECLKLGVGKSYRIRICASLESESHASWLPRSDFFLLKKTNSLLAC